MVNRIQLNVSKPGFSLVVDMELPSQGITVLYGPSGSGKTTVLRCIAGLERSPQALVQFRQSALTVAQRLDAANDRQTAGLRAGPRFE